MIDKVYDSSGNCDKDWKESVREIWQNKSTWERIYYIGEEF